MRFALTPRTHYEVECWRAGVCVWRESFHNLVVQAGKDKLLDAMFLSGSALPVWSVGLVAGSGFTAYALADTMASHAGWAESVAYGQPTRVVCTFASAGVGIISNAAAKAAFTMNATTTIRGAFLVNQNTIGGTTGTLYGVGDFAVVRSVIMGDIVNVIISISM